MRRLIHCASLVAAIGTTLAICTPAATGAPPHRTRGLCRRLTLTPRPPSPNNRGRGWHGPGAAPVRGAFARVLAPLVLPNLAIQWLPSPLYLGKVRVGLGLPQVAPAARKPYLAVLVWHDVLPARQVWFDTPLALFKQQLARIRRGGYHILTLAQLRDHLVNGTPVPPRPLVLTFDDNNQGLFDYAFPLLKQYHWPATLFVHTAYVGVTTSKRHNTWPELQEMENSGLITVQSLTENHPPDLRALPDSQILKELTDSRATLEKRLGKPIYALVYPQDNYDLRVARLAHRAGYQMAFTEDWGSAGASPNLLEIHRYSILKRFDQALRDVARAWPDRTKSASVR